MKNLKIAGAVSLLLIIMVICMPASALILEETYMGWISKLEPSKDRIHVYVTDVYQGDGTWLTYGKSTLTNQIVPGTTSNPSVFNDLKQGDSVEVTLMGGSGGEWITIGKIGSTGSTAKPIISCYGDPSRLISPFYRNYEIDFTPIANCAFCDGTICTASVASVTVKKDGLLVETADMFPGSTHVFGWDNTSNQYIPQVTFVSGEAGSGECSSLGGEIMEGPQAVSDFTIYITQRSSIIRSEVETLDTEVITVTATETATTPETAVQTAAETTVPTPATPGFTAICVLFALSAALCIFKVKMR